MLTNIYGLFTKPPCLLQRNFNSIAVTIGGTAYRNQTSDGQFHRFSSFSRAKPLDPNDVLPTKLLNICNARPGTRLYHEAIWMFHIRWLASFIPFFPNFNSVSLYARAMDCALTSVQFFVVVRNYLYFCWTICIFGVFVIGWIAFFNRHFNCLFPSKAIASIQTENTLNFEIVIGKVLWQRPSGSCYLQLKTRYV